MKNITKQIIGTVFSKELQKPMGRWNIDYCSIKMNKKVDLSNEDHCGPCGQYSKEIQTKNEMMYTNHETKYVTPTNDIQRCKPKM